MPARLNPFFVKPGPFSLAKIDPAATPLSSGNKEADRTEISRLAARISEMQDVFFAARRHKLLVVLQGMDTSGKDGAVRAVFQGVHPLGMRVVSFKAPTAQERDHDFQWRVHAQVPGAGEMTIFNRSHYEDVLITRVHGWIDDREAQQRIRHINDFERMLTDTGTTILKFFLHISKDEQKKRLEQRLRDGTRHWKFAADDLNERQFWDDYIRIYEETLGATSTTHAPWMVVPANSKTHRSLMIALRVVRALEEMKLAYPPPQPEYFKLVVK